MDVPVSGQRGALDLTHFRDHDHIVVRVERAAFKHRGNALALLQIQEIRKMEAAGCLRAVRDLVAFELVHVALVRDKEDIVMRRADEHFLNEILLALLHALHAASAALLRLVFIERHALDIALVGIGDNAVLDLDELLDVQLAGDLGDLGAALVGEFPSDLAKLLGNDLVDLLAITENVLQLGNFLAERKQLVRDLLALQTRQCTQTHLHDRLRLLLGQTDRSRDMQTGQVIFRAFEKCGHVHILKALHQALLALRDA